MENEKEYIQMLKVVTVRGVFRCFVSGPGDS